MKWNQRELVSVLVRAWPYFDPLLPFLTINSRTLRCIPLQISSSMSQLDIECTIYWTSSLPFHVFAKIRHFVLAIASLATSALGVTMPLRRVVSEKDEQHNVTKTRNWHSQLEHRMWRHSDRLHAVMSDPAV